MKSLLVAVIVVVGTMTARDVHPQTKINAWKAVEVWRADGTESGEPFGSLRDYVVGKDGTLWALDFKDQKIRRYASDGKALSTVARLGSGPGELRKANGMLVMPDGSVWVNDPSNGRYTVFNANGTFQKQLLASITSYGFRWNSWYDAQRKEVIEQLLSSPGGWTRLNAEAKNVGTLPPTLCTPLSEGGGTYIRAETVGKGSMNAAYPFAQGGGNAADGKGISGAPHHMGRESR